MIRVRTINNCGYSDAAFLEVGTDNCFYRMSYTVSPNPAKNVVTIDGRKKEKDIHEIHVIDKTGNVKRMGKYSGKTKLVTFNISGLQPGIYFVKIFDGKNWEVKQLNIQ